MILAVKEFEKSVTQLLNHAENCSVPETKPHTRIQSQRSHWHTSRVPIELEDDSGASNNSFHHGGSKRLRAQDNRDFDDELSGTCISMTITPFIILCFHEEKNALCSISGVDGVNVRATLIVEV